MMANLTQIIAGWHLLAVSHIYFDVKITILIAYTVRVGVTLSLIVAGIHTF